MQTAPGLPPGKARLRPRLIAVSVTGSVIGELELARQRGPLLRQRRSLCSVQGDLQDAETQDRALEADRSERDSDLLEQLLLGESADVARLATLDHLHQHRR